jgi:lipopolysaccharide/colanic/teichoic acid biosynthesis glycosyltransferase
MHRIGRRYDPVKRIFDVTVAVAVLPLVVPLLVLCAVAIRIDSPGPVLFSQQRTGRDGRRFGMFKFRTMVVNAEELKASLQHLSIVPAPDFKVPNDPRVTRVGRILRATSLDELPQIWNILRGDMSLVGPRPTSFNVDTYDLWHTRRLEVQPGVTGMWQIYGRNTTDFDARLRLDEYYIRNRCLALDLKLIMLTVPAVVRREGS